MIKAVCGLIHDDEFKKKYGCSRFFHLNGEIKTNSDGDDIYVCSRYNENTGRTEDVSEKVMNMPAVVQEFIKKYSMYTEDPDALKYIGVHSSELI